MQYILLTFPGNLCLRNCDTISDATLHFQARNGDTPRDTMLPKPPVKSAPPISRIFPHRPSIRKAQPISFKPHNNCILHWVSALNTDIRKLIELYSASFHLVFCHHFFLFSGISVLNTLPWDVFLPDPVVACTPRIHCSIRTHLVHRNPFFLSLHCSPSSRHILHCRPDHCFVALLKFCPSSLQFHWHPSVAQYSAAFHPISPNCDL